MEERTEVDVQHCCISTFDENLFRAIDNSFIQISDRIDGHRTKVFRELFELLDGLFDVTLQIGER